MEVVRRRGAALRPVVKDAKIRAEIGHEPKERNEGRSRTEALGLVLRPANGEVGGKDGHGVAEDQIVVPVKDAFLFFRQILAAQKTGSPGYGLFPDIGKGARYPSRIMLRADGKTPARDHPFS
jgi:hypothetical protein